MTEPCTKEAELARIDQRTLNMEADIKEIHRWLVGNGDGIMQKIRGQKVQLTIQWGVFVFLFGLLAWILKS